MTVEAVLAALLVITNVFWVLNTHKLLNKLMSRTYLEYQEAQLKPKENKGTMGNVNQDAMEDFGSLSELGLG